MGVMIDIASKGRRALSNDTGVHLTLEQWRALVEAGVWSIITSGEQQELTSAWAKNPNPTSSETAGSESGATGSRLESTKSAAIPKSLGPQFIEALGLGT